MKAASTTQEAGAAQQEQAAGGNDAEELGEGHISGNLTQDPELRYTPTGRAVTKMRLAYSQRVKNPGTNRWEDGPPEYYDIDVWGKQGENCAEAFIRGDRVVAVGTWFRRSWTTRDGEQRTSVTLTARDIGPSCLFRQVSINRTRRSGPPMSAAPPSTEPPPDDTEPEDLPF